MNTGLLRPAVATAPTVYGIETIKSRQKLSAMYSVATAPTVYGIETYNNPSTWVGSSVATAPTVYGIETIW